MPLSASIWGHRVLYYSFRKVIEFSENELEILFLLCS